MAEIKDVYSLEFNGSQFQTEINSAIQSIDELNNAMAEGVDVADDLESAQANLVNVLNTEAKGVEQLNQKRDTLVKTQKAVNAESKAGVAVGKQLDATNKQIAVSTGQAAGNQRGFAGSLVQGVRQIGQMRRVASTLTFAFRAITAAIPFGIILSLAGPIISFFSSLVKGTDDSAENMEKLKDNTLSYAEKIPIIELELRKLQNIENERGKLTDEEKQKRAELIKSYEDSKNEIIKIEEDRLKRQIEIEDSIKETRIRILGDTIEAAEESYKLETERIIREAGKRGDELRLEDKKLFADLAKAKEEYDRTGADSARLERDRLEEALTISFNTALANVKEQDLKLQLAEKEKNKKIADIIKRAEEKKKSDRLKAIQDELKDIEKLNQFRINLTEEGTTERNQAELNAINILEEAYKKYAEELGMDILDLELLYQDNTKKREDSDQKRIESMEKVRAAQLKAIEDMKDAYEKDLENYKKSIDAASDYRVNNAETNLNMQLLELEKERNQKLLMAFEDADEQAKIDKEYNEKRKNLETKANQEVIKLRIEFLEKLRDASADDPAALASLNKQISELKLKYEELNKVIDDNSESTKNAKKSNEEAEKQAKELADKQKEIIEQTAQLITGVSDSVFSVLNAQVQAYISGLDKAINKSKSALDEIRANSEDFNARQLEIEKERLEKLEAERARAVEREKTLAQVQLAINAAIAISKAAAEGGAAAPVTIALTLAALIAGLAQARVASGNAFFKGVEYLERGQNKAGRDTIPAMLNEGERVITTDTNDKYWDVLSAVHNNRIPADVLNTFSKAYQQGGIKNALGAFGNNVSLSGELGQKSIFVNVAQSYGGLENRLERIENVLTELPKYMPKTTVSANANGIFRIVEQRQARKNFSRNWSK
jgi:hypothetical protein